MKGKNIHFSYTELFHTLKALDYHIARHNHANGHYTSAESSLKRVLRKMIKELVMENNRVSIALEFLNLDSDTGNDYYEKLLRDNP